MSGGGSAGKTTSEPWKGQEPYLQDIYSRAAALNKSNLPGVYYGTRVAPFTPDQLAAQAGIRNLASPGGLGGQALSYYGNEMAGRPAPGAAGAHLNNLITSGIMPGQAGAYLRNELSGIMPGQAGAYLRNELSGKYLDAGNPHFRAMADRIARGVIPNVQSSFESSGRYGGGYNSQAVGQAIADKVGDLAYQDYGAERGLQQQAAGLLGGYQNQAAGLLSGYQNQAAMAQRAYQDQAAGAAPALAQGLLGSLGQSGALQQGQQQQNLQTLMDRFNEQQQGPWARLGMFANAINAGGQFPSSTTRSPTPSFASQLIAGLAGSANMAGNLAPFFV